MTTYDAGAGEILLSGPLTIRHVGDIREVLLASLAAHRTLTLTLPADAEADISFVQLVLAAQASARAGGKEIRLKEPPSGPLLEVLTRGGFLEAADAGLWSKETLPQ